MEVVAVIDVRQPDHGQMEVFGLLSGPRSFNFQAKAQEIAFHGHSLPVNGIYEVTDMSSSIADFLRPSTLGILMNPLFPRSARQILIPNTASSTCSVCGGDFWLPRILVAIFTMN